MGADASGGIGHVVVEANGMINSEGPECGIGDVRPMDCRVEHHSASN